MLKRIKRQIERALGSKSDLPTAEAITTIYRNLQYDDELMPNFASFKKRAVKLAQFNSGDNVLIFCVGTGFDLTFVLEQIGPSGNILAVDSSPEMLANAEKRIKRRGWKNITLVEADVTARTSVEKALSTVLRPEDEMSFDAAICTLGMSVIPAAHQAYDNLVSFVRPGGKVLVGDAFWVKSGWRSWLNPVFVSFARKFGGSKAGHILATEVMDRMQKELHQVRTEIMPFLGFYFACCGITAPHKEI